MENTFTNLGSLVDTIIDYRGKTPLKLNGQWEESSIGNYRALSAKNVKTGQIVQHDEIRYVSPELYKKWMKIEIQRGDIIITSEAPFGQIFHWDSDEKIVLSQRLFAIRLNKKINSKYAYYYFTSQSFQAELKARSTGSTVEGLRQPALLKSTFAYPDYQTQTKIANVLSNYDKLIDINKQKIELLEKTIESIYKEWFVRFRFPGYENYEFDAGKPIGWVSENDNKTELKPKAWSYGELDNICEFKRGKNITADEMIQGEIPVISAGLNPSGYHNKANVCGSSLTISASGANAGYLSYHLDDIWAADCSYCQSKYIWFVYNTLKYLQPVITNMQIGSAQPHVYAKNINKLSVILPEEQLIKRFCEFVNPIYDEIGLLEKQNINLEKQRDALLPRLMSGRLIV